MEYSGKIQLKKSSYSLKSSIEIQKHLFQFGIKSCPGNRFNEITVEEESGKYYIEMNKIMT
jgi:hypothetical protein